MIFPTEFEQILDRINQVDPLQYGKTRNSIDGAVTYLSPYISRGVISTKMVLENMLHKGYQLHEIETFVKELCWRDYFQRVSQFNDINQDIRQPQEPILNLGIPTQITNANTGILGVDSAIHDLYNTGYMHNHCRMYTAFMVCNIAKSHWKNPAMWMYYYLLDGDWASNACSWQWVSGANSNKKYYANQENINKFTLTNQKNSFLDKSYEEIERMETPALLLDTEIFISETALPDSDNVQINNTLPTFIYNYYNLDPLWHKAEPGNRILLLEPEFFRQYPVGIKCIDFMLALSKNIPEIQIYVGSFQSFYNKWKSDNIYFKEHPLNIGYKGIEENRDWIEPNVNLYFNSFFGYWKKVQKQLFNRYK